MFPLLDDYLDYKPTKSCFLDGRFISLVLKDVPEFHKQPIFLNMEFDENNRVVSSGIHGALDTRDGMNIVRVVITTPEVAHSALVWIDTRSKTITLTDVRLNGLVTPLVRAIDNTVDSLLQEFFVLLSHYKYFRDVAYVDEMSDAHHCEKFGFCNAYVIKQVVDYVQGNAFDSAYILKFAAAIEKRYSHLLDPNTEPEVEYQRYGGYGGRGWGGRGYGYRGFGGAGLGLGLGVLGGVALGSALAAPYGYGYPAYGYPAPYYGYPAGYYY